MAPLPPLALNKHLSQWPVRAKPAIMARYRPTKRQREASVSKKTNLTCRNMYEGNSPDANSHNP